MYLAVDPGKANGVAVFDNQAKLIYMGVVDEKDFVGWLGRLDPLPRVVIVEDYQLYPHKAKAQIYSDMIASRVIGRLEFWAKDRGIKLVKQPANLKTMGYRYMGEKVRKGDHAYDALVHGIFYLIKNRIMRTQDLPNR